MSIVMHNAPALSCLAVDSIASLSHRSKPNSVSDHIKSCSAFAICQSWHELDGSFENPFSHSGIWICFGLARLVAAANDGSASSRPLHDVRRLFWAIISTTDERDTPCCVVTQEYDVTSCWVDGGVLHSCECCRSKAGTIHDDGSYSSA